MLLMKLDAHDLQFENFTNFDGTYAYAQNKVRGHQFAFIPRSTPYIMQRQQIIMTREWAKAYPRIHFSAMHPGWTDTPSRLSILQLVIW